MEEVSEAEVGVEGGQKGRERNSRRKKKGEDSVTVSVGGDDKDTVGGKVVPEGGAGGLDGEEAAAWKFGWPTVSDSR